MHHILLLKKQNALQIYHSAPTNQLPQKELTDFINGDFNSDCFLLDIGISISAGRKTISMINWLFPKKTKETRSGSTADVLTISRASNLKSKAEWDPNYTFDFFKNSIKFEEIQNLI